MALKYVTMVAYGDTFKESVINKLWYLENYKLPNINKILIAEEECFVIFAIFFCYFINAENVVLCYSNNVHLVF